MGVLVEIADGQLLHALEDLFTEAQHRALRDIDHQAVIGVAGNDAKQQHESQLEQGLHE